MLMRCHWDAAAQFVLETVSLTAHFSQTPTVASQAAARFVWPLQGANTQFTPCTWHKCDKKVTVWGGLVCCHPERRSWVQCSGEQGALCMQCACSPCVFCWVFSVFSYSRCTTMVQSHHHMQAAPWFPFHITHTAATCSFIFIINAGCSTKQVNSNFYFKNH